MDRLTTIGKSDPPDKIEFFQTVAVPLLLYGCTTDFNETWRKTCHYEQTATHKTAAVWPLATHLTNHLSTMNMTC